MAFPLLNTVLLTCFAFCFTVVQAQNYGPVLPEGRLASSPGQDGNFHPVVIYQAVNTGYPLAELRATNNGWRYGTLTSPDAAYRPKIGTPLTSVLYPTTGQIYLFYMSTNNKLVERVQSHTGQWSDPRYLNRDMYSGSRGMTSYMDGTGQITIWYQDSANTIKRCLWRSAGCLDETGGGPSIGNVLPGSDIASLQDDVMHQHVYYQGNDAGNPIREMAWENNQWNFGVLVENAPPKVSFESIMSPIKPGVPEYSGPTPQFWQLNQQIFNQLTLTIYDGPACAGWCYAKSLIQTRDYTAALSVTAKNGPVRAYFITSDGKLGELGNNDSGTGWGVVPDLLAVTT